MTDLSIKFEDAIKLSTIKLKSLILGERDRISKNWIAKMYRKGYSLKKAYEIYYQNKLWKNCIRPLLIAYGIKSKAIKKLKIGFQCNNCRAKLPNQKLIVPHHIEYPPLAKKYKYKGFDNRIKLNHPNRIKFLCINCHSQYHEEIKKREESRSELISQFLSNKN